MIMHQKNMLDLIDLKLEKEVLNELKDMEFFVKEENIKE